MSVGDLSTRLLSRLRPIWPAPAIGATAVGRLTTRSAVTHSQGLPLYTAGSGRRLADDRRLSDLGCPISLLSQEPAGLAISAQLRLTPTTRNSMQRGESE
jgi:hypothetical protein